MTSPGDLQRLSPTVRAQLIYGAAKRGDELALWRAALGRTTSTSSTTAPATSPLLDFQSLLQALQPDTTTTAATDSTTNSLDLGPNQALAGTVSAAAERTGLPAAALAAIVNAESARTADGEWNPASRNPRSSATGIGQFLNRTWLGEAERSGTYLHQLAADRGWLDSSGKVTAKARTALLDLRSDPTVSIQAVADYARGNLDRLAKHGIDTGTSVGAVARTAWLAHHLGAGDAIRFLGQGLPPDRAEQLLSAQVGSSAAERRIASAGDATTAHRQWLLGYLDRHLKPDSFTA